MRSTTGMIGNLRVKITALVLASAAIAFGAGIQSYHGKRFRDQAAYGTRKTSLATGVGIKLTAFRKAYGEFDSRFEGYPWWKLEIGYRLF